MIYEDAASIYHMTKSAAVFNRMPRYALATGGTGALVGAGTGAYSAPEGERGHAALEGARDGLVAGLAIGSIRGIVPDLAGNKWKPEMREYIMNAVIPGAILGFGEGRGAGIKRKNKKKLEGRKRKPEGVSLTPQLLDW